MTKDTSQVEAQAPGLGEAAAHDDSHGEKNDTAAASTPSPSVFSKVANVRPRRLGRQDSVSCYGIPPLTDEIS